MNYILEQSPRDNKFYKYLKLNNNLQCLIIKDDSESMCGACLNINVGSIYEKIDGLAHFLEHMVFMGSKKYPDTTNFMGSINKSGGETNASTGSTYTNYHFTINPENFLQTLDKFSQFFIDPLLNKKYVDKEINAVNSESEKNKLDDLWITQEILRTLAVEKHPINHYSCGTTETLTRDDIYDKLKEFHDTYYLAQYMGLIVYINKDIDLNNLIKQIEDTFGIIKYNDDKLINNFGDIIRNKDIVYYVPNKSEHKMSIVCQFKRVKKLIQSPYYFIKHLFSNQYEKSIYDFFLNKNYVVQSEISDIVTLDDYEVFTIEYELTDFGIENYEFIYNYVIEYLKYIIDKINIKDEHLRNIYDEMLQTNKNNYEFWEEDDIVSTITFLSHIILEDIKKEHLLSFDTHLVDFDTYCEVNKDILKDYKIGVSVGSKKFNKICNQKFPIYNTCYKIDKIINSKEISDDFTLPILNNYICYNLKVNNEVKQMTEPKLIPNDRFNSYYYGDKKFNIPIVDIKCIIKIPNILKSVETYVGMILYLNSAYSHINPLKNMATDAGYILVTRLEHDLLYIYISGYNENIKKVIEIIHNMLNTSFEKSHFKIARYNLMQTLLNVKHSSPLTQMNIKLDDTIYKKYYTPEEQLRVITNIDMKKCCEIFKANYNDCRVSILSCGNITEEEGDNLNNIMYNSLSLNKQIEIDLSESVNKINDYKKIVKFDNPDENNSVMTYNYKLFRIKKDLTSKWKSLLLFSRICNSILSYKYFYKLRTEEQLGYIVKTKILTIIDNYNYTCILQFLIQSPKVKCDELVNKTEKFIEEETDFILNKMSIEEYNHYVDGERSKLRKKFNNLSSLGAYFTNSLIDESNIFNINELLLEKLDKFSIDKFRKYFNKLIVNNNKKFILGIDGNDDISS